jgi:nitroreductase
MDILDIIRTRRSVRQFQPVPVEAEKVEALLRAGMQAPSAHNEQPWAFVVVTDRKLLDEYGNAFPTSKPLLEAPLCIVVCALKERIKGPMYPQDLSAATQNILLEAVSLGLGTCWLGVHAREERMAFVSKLLNLPAEVEPFSAIAIGYPKDADAFKFRDYFNPERIHTNRW